MRRIPRARVLVKRSLCYTTAHERELRVRAARVPVDSRRQRARRRRTAGRARARAVRRARPSPERPHQRAALPARGAGDAANGQLAGARAPRQAAPAEAAALLLGRRHGLEAARRRDELHHSVGSARRFGQRGARAGSAGVRVGARDRRTGRRSARGGAARRDAAVPLVGPPRRRRDAARLPGDGGAVRVRPARRAAAARAAAGLRRGGRARDPDQGDGRRVRGRATHPGVPVAASRAARAARPRGDRDLRRARWRSGSRGTSRS